MVAVAGIVIDPVAVFDERLRGSMVDDDCGAVARGIDPMGEW